jgi:hypothetical protein
MAADAWVQCRVRAATKARLRAMADELGVTETQLVRSHIERLVADRKEIDPAAAPKRPALGRLAIRVRPDDRELLAARAAERGLAPATYAGVILRAHLRHLAPLPRDELAALKRSTAELAAIGRNLNQIAKVAHRDSRVPSGAVAFESMLKVATALREHVKSLVRANVASWESGHE